MSEARTINTGGRQGRGDPLASRRMRRFRVEVDAGGYPFTWTGQAVNEQAAFRCAAHDLAVKFPNVEAESMTLTACVEVAA